MTLKSIKLSVMAVLAMQVGVAQDWARLPGGNVINANEWFGADLLSTIPLSFETRVNQPMLWSTNSTLRMRLIPDNFAGNINTYPGLNLSGFLGLGQFVAGGLVPQPFAFIHIDDGGWQDSGYRPWMRQGTLITHQSDQSYFGMKDELLNRNHTVIGWSDNDPTDNGWDLLKFIFVADNTAVTGTAGTLDGLEAARFSPAISGNETFFGLGDWFNSGGLVPTERFDMLNGRGRFRQLPNDPVSTSMEIVTVNTTVGPNFGVLEHRPLGPLLGGANCEWTMNAVAPNHVFTAVGPMDPLCPDDAENVGIGNAAPVAKLDITKSVNSGTGTDVGLNIRMGTTSANNTGGIASLQFTGTQNIGWQAGTVNASKNWGVSGAAAANNLANNTLPAWTAARLVGVRGFADGNLVSPASSIRGVWGIGIGTVTGGPGFAGWFDGLTHCTNFGWQSSDAMFKEDVEPLAGALGIIQALQPKKYRLKADEYPTMAFDSSLQFGFLAQDVEAVLPEIVMDLEQPEQMDSLGSVIAPAFSFKAMQYDAIIPWLVGGMQEQQAIIHQQNTRLDQLEQLVSACCILGTDSRTMQDQGNGIGYIDNTQRVAADARQLNADELVVTPNPFTENPTISYRIGTNGRAQLRVSDAHGRAMGTLFDAGIVAGQHSMVWNTAAMAAGTYWLVLTLDGQRITEQAVKVE